MHLTWYGFDSKNKEHNDFIEELNLVSKKMGINTPTILNFGVEDSVVGVYNLSEYGQISWFGNGRDDIESKMRDNLKWKNKHEAYKKAQEFLKELKYDSLSKEEIEEEINDLHKESYYGSYQNSNDMGYGIQSPEKVGRALKIIASRLRLNNLVEYYEEKFKVKYDNGSVM